MAPKGLPKRSRGGEESAPVLGLDGSWGILGGSWKGLGVFWGPRADFNYFLLIFNGFWSFFKDFWMIFQWFLINFWCLLALWRAVGAALDPPQRKLWGRVFYYCSLDRVVFCIIKGPQDRILVFSGTPRIVPGPSVFGVFFVLFSKSLFWGFGGQHGPNMVPTGPREASKIEKNILEKGSYVGRCFWLIFYWFWQPLGWIFGGFWMLSWEPSWLKNRSYGLLLASWPK